MSTSIGVARRPALTLLTTASTLFFKLVAPVPSSADLMPPWFLQHVHWHLDAALPHREQYIRLHRMAGPRSKMQKPCAAHACRRA